MLYDNGRTRVKCYFEDAPKGVTCGTTGKLRVKGKTYDLLLEFYGIEIPELPVSADTLAILVLFRRLGRPQWVAADRVRVRVMNENTPDSLKTVDKIAPRGRRTLLEGFWKTLEPDPLGKVAKGLPTASGGPIRTVCLGLTRFRSSSAIMLALRHLHLIQLTPTRSTFAGVQRFWTTMVVTLYLRRWQEPFILKNAPT